MKAEQVKTINIPTSVLGLDVSADGKEAYAACMDGTVQRVDVAAGTCETLLKHDSFASGVCRVPESSLLITSGYDGQLQWYDLAAKQLVRQVPAHKFWSWQTALAPDGKRLVSVTGQYLAGSIKYDPAPETEPSVKIFDATSGELVHALSHLPPVQAVAISPDSQYVAAGNLTGDIRVWEMATGKELANFNTPAFTSWGIIKSHCYQNGIYALAFSPDNESVLACGMGPMRDPMAGNGKQTWQRFSWRKEGSPKTDEIHDGDHGGGLPESIVYHPSQRYFVMAGRLAQGKWNTGFFDEPSGALRHSLDTKCRLTKAVFTPSGEQLFLAGSVGQPTKFAPDGKYDHFGRIFVYSIGE